MEVGIKTHYRPTWRYYNQHLFLRLPNFIPVNIAGGHSNRPSPRHDTYFVGQQRHLGQHTRLTESFIDTSTMGLQNLRPPPQWDNPVTNSSGTSQKNKAITKQNQQSSKDYKFFVLYTRTLNLEMRRMPKTRMKNYKWTKIKSNKEVETGSKSNLPEFWRR